MTILFYISFIFSSFLPKPRPVSQAVDICRLYGAIYVETQNRNRADMIVYVDNQASFPELKVYLQENALYADKPGMWYLTKDISMADYVIYIEKEEGLTRHVISYVDTESQAGCQ